LLALSLWALYIAIQITLEDYNTSLAAYAAIPTRKINPDIVRQAAWLPQILPVLMGFTFLRDTQKWYWAVAALAIMAIDMWTDTWFKTQGLDLTWTGVGFLETFFVFTVGSEILLTLSSSIVFTLARPGTVQLFMMIKGIKLTLREIKGELQGAGSPLGEEDERGYTPSFPTSGYRRKSVAAQPRRNESYQTTHFFDGD
jgi:hypothetical protein